jgi:hypothetical protein
MGTLENEGTHKVTPVTVYCTINIGNDAYAMTKEDGDALMELLRKAEFYQTTGWGDAKMHYIGGPRSPEVTQGILSEMLYLRGKLAGPKPAAEDD